MPDVRETRPVSWTKAALKELRTFPEDVPSICLAALTIAGRAVRRISENCWRQSTTGSKTAPREMEVVRNRLEQLKEMFT